MQAHTRESMPMMSPLQDTKRSHSKSAPNVPVKTLPLPLELVFRPDVRGVYNPRKPSLNDDSLVDFEFEPKPEFGSGGPTQDAWLMREAFLRARSLQTGLDAITLTFGRFGKGREDISVPSVKCPTSWKHFDAGSLLGDEFDEWQSLIRAAMTIRMAEWPQLESTYPTHKVDLLCQPMRLAVEWHDGRPTGTIRCSGVLQALVATLQVDALLNAEYRFCACVGCANSFMLRRKDQRYCDDRCKHKQVVRDGRARQGKAPAEIKVPTTERKQQ